MGCENCHLQGLEPLLSETYCNMVATVMLFTVIALMQLEVSNQIDPMEVRKEPFYQTLETSVLQSHSRSGKFVIWPTYFREIPQPFSKFNSVLQTGFRKLNVCVLTVTTGLSTSTSVITALSTTTSTSIATSTSTVTTTFVTTLTDTSTTTSLTISTTTSTTITTTTSTTTSSITTTSTSTSIATAVITSTSTSIQIVTSTTFPTTVTPTSTLRVTSTSTIISTVPRTNCPNVFRNNFATQANWLDADHWPYNMLRGATSTIANAAYTLY